MGKPLKDESGKRYGSWTVIKRAENRGSCACWVVRCDCGVVASVIGTTLRSGASTRCVKCNQTGKNSTTHGKSKTREYSIWCGIICRTENPNVASYKNYGERGIRMSPEWRGSFQTFLADMGEAPPGMTVERKNNSLGYNKENCIWASKKVQSRNTRQNIVLEVDGVSLCMTDWAIKTGIGYSTLMGRIRRYGLSDPSKILYKGNLKCKKD